LPERRSILLGVLASLLGPTTLAQGPIAAAIADPLRPVADRERDAARKPAETLAFAGIAPGQTVVEIFPGPGYFTRLISRTIGPSGRLYTVPWGEPDTGASRRLATDPAYGNINAYLQNLLGFRPPWPADVIFTTQNYHDIGTPQRAQANKVLFNALKPGGIYFILDHSGAVGSGYAALPLHRMDEALLKKEMAEAGFRLVAESQILRNPADDRKRSAFDPAIRGRTDQFLMKFEKPGP